ncbi:Fe-S oxidoreductase [uncultured Gammaproteobacteria bacterium]
MVKFDFPLWRPPSEGDNLIIQATLGCRFNHCTFCSMYKEKTYQARPLEAVFADIDQAAREWPDAHRVFLADGDAYNLPKETLLAIAGRLKERFPALQRISAYATPFNILGKSPEEIAALKAARLGLVYLGVESGADRLLKAITKGSAKQMEAALARARETGIKVSATVILGLGGKIHWREHIEATAAMINRQPPAYLSTLQLVLDPAVAPGFFGHFGEPFQWQDDQGVLEELRLLIDLLAPSTPVIFRSNHASNALPLAGTLPKDRTKLLAEIDGALTLRPRWLRGL